MADEATMKSFSGYENIVCSRNNINKNLNKSVTDLCLKLLTHINCNLYLYQRFFKRSTRINYTVALVSMKNRPTREINKVNFSCGCNNIFISSRGQSCGTE